MEKKQKRMFYFEFDAQKWLSKTSKIQWHSFEEKGVFIEICAFCLLEGGKIADDEFLPRKLGISEATLSKCLNLLIQNGLIISGDGFLSVKFISEKIKKASEIHEKRVQAGGKGGKAYKQKEASAKICSSKNKPPFQEQEQEQDKKENTLKSVKEKRSTHSENIVKPPPENIAEVQVEAGKIGYAMTNAEAENFMAHYSAGNWMDKHSKPIRNWPQLLVIWKNNRHEFRGKKTPKKKGEKSYAL